MHWGVMLAQGWKGELGQVGRAGSWSAACEWARRAEELGFDGIWVFDHFQPYPARDDRPVLEAWTTLAALSQVTGRVLLGTLVSCAAYREPAVTVKMAENLQMLSGGRFCLGVGAGWDKPEFESLGVRFGTAGERSDRLEAVLRAARQASDATGGGDAVQPGAGSAVRRPQILVGGEGEMRTMPAAVKYADAVNWQVGAGGFAAKSRVLATVCERAGRDPGSLLRAHAPNFQLFDSEREFARWRQHPDRGMSAQQVDAYIRERGAFYGTESAIRETAEEFVELGCRGFMVYCNRTPDLGCLDELTSAASVAAA